MRRAAGRRSILPVLALLGLLGASACHQMRPGTPPGNCVRIGRNLLPVCNPPPAPLPAAG